MTDKNQMLIIWLIVGLIVIFDVGAYVMLRTQQHQQTGFTQAVEINPERIVLTQFWSELYDQQHVVFHSLFASIEKQTAAMDLTLPSDLCTTEAFEKLEAYRKVRLLVLNDYSDLKLRTENWLQNQVDRGKDFGDMQNPPDSLHTTGAWKFAYYFEALHNFQIGQDEQAAQVLFDLLRIGQALDQSPVLRNISVTRPMERDIARLMVLFSPQLDKNTLSALRRVLANRPSSETLLDLGLEHFALTHRDPKDVEIPPSFFLARFKNGFDHYRQHYAQVEAIKQIALASTGRERFNRFPNGERDFEIVSNNICRIQTASLR
jgi:hypothetical protein